MGFEMQEECPRCGFIAVTGRPCPRCGAAIGPSLGQVFLQPFADAGKQISSGGGSSSSGGGGKAVGCLVLLVLGGAMIFGVGRCLNCDFSKSDAEKSVGKEIAWGTKADLPAGKRYEFTCPKDGTPGDVVGSDSYDADESSICTAAVHAGVIGLKEGGRVTIDVQDKKGLVLRGSERNGIKSVDSSTADDHAGRLNDKDAGQPDWSDKVFSVVGAPPPPPVTTPPVQPAKQAPSSSARPAKKAPSPPAKPAVTASAKPAAVPSGEAPSE